MQTNYLLPNKYKILGWVLFTIGLAFGIFLLLNEYESDLLNAKVLAIYYEGIFDSQDGFFKIINNNIVDELATICIIIGGLIVGFTKEKIEDEFIYKLRKDSLVWAIIVNYLILIFTIVFIYNMTFFHVLVLNMFTPLIFFIIRFNFLKFKSQNHEE
ncbi:hypothetical protein RXV94_13600 [Yeosuana sp. MJ-SS3]|uniref:Uncharacterized protein n=1 Tax=Gilvirhabdus luticola TaxID=3079858 RepID=A0ABU3UA61_9FLAO|nr:hypothetical protein [Yeosuana sp. MJ-SS3]MDU8887201.1 hypothetical protein [Yeosuana sp. MJ-SS3]